VTPEQVLEHFKRSGAMLEGHFLLSSGRHSDRYFQCALLLAHPRLAEDLARALAFKLPQDIDVVVGPALGAVTWAYEVGRALGKRAFFTERNNGQMELRRGFQLAPGERVLVVEDVLTTGGSVREVLAVVAARRAVRRRRVDRQSLGRGESVRGRAHAVHRARQGQGRVLGAQGVSAVRLRETRGGDQAGSRTGAKQPA
jgi:orotate phosphoribosyltransferase